MLDSDEVTTQDPPQCESNEACPAEPDCSGCPDAALVADPEDCRGFYICTSEVPSSLPLDCPAGQVFNASGHECVDGDACEECPVVPPTGSCSYECVADGPPNVSSQFDCGVFYECDGTTVTGPVACDASTPFFNGEDCQTDERLCCHCHPYCTADDVGKFAAGLPGLLLLHNRL